MESAANRLQKEAKGYLDSLRGEMRLQSPPWRSSRLTAPSSRSDDRVPDENSGDNRRILRRRRYQRWGLAIIQAGRRRLGRRNDQGT
jgi:hypothetical protein